MIYHGQEITVDDFFKGTHPYREDVGRDHIKKGENTVGYRFMYEASNGTLHPPIFGNKAWLEHEIQSGVSPEFPFYAGQVNHVPDDANNTLNKKGAGGVFYFPHLQDAEDYFAYTLLEDSPSDVGLQGPSQQLFTFRHQVPSQGYDKLQKRSMSSQGWESNTYDKSRRTIKDATFRGKQAIYDENFNKVDVDVIKEVKVGDKVQVTGRFNLYRIEGTSKGKHPTEIGDIINDFYIYPEPEISISVQELHDYFNRSGVIGNLTDKGPFLK